MANLLMSTSMVCLNCVTVSFAPMFTSGKMFRYTLRTEGEVGEEEGRVSHDENVDGVESLSVAFVCSALRGIALHRCHCVCTT